MISDVFFAVALILLVYSLFQLKIKPNKHFSSRGTIGIYYASKGGTAAKLSDLLRERFNEKRIKSTVINIRDFAVI